MRRNDPNPAGCCCILLVVIGLFLVLVFGMVQHDMNAKKIVLTDILPEGMHVCKNIYTCESPAIVRYKNKEGEPFFCNTQTCVTLSQYVGTTNRAEAFRTILAYHYMRYPYGIPNVWERMDSRLPETNGYTNAEAQEANQKIIRERERSGVY